MEEVTIGQVPEFITFLFSRKPKFDCYFIVGNKDMGEPERIGGVKLMLMAHSDVFRCELEDSEIVEKDDVKLEDTQPETFKSMLKYVYGHDTTSEMPFDEADNLLYLAEKYMIKRLKDRVATRLMCLLTPDNICSLLNNPVCYTHLELDTAITKILQYETDKVLASTEFLSLNPEGFLKILKQNGLAVYEIELWRAAVKWAKHRAGTEDVAVLRKQFSAVGNHIRVCTLQPSYLRSEVATTNILTQEEMALVSRSVVMEVKESSLIMFSNEIERRKKLCKTEKITKYLDWIDENTRPSQCENPTYCFEVITKYLPIEMVFCEIRAKDRKRTEPEGWTYKVDCNVSVRKVRNTYIHDGSSKTEDDNPPMTVRVSQFVRLGGTFIINFSIDDKYVILLPKSKYSITMSFTGAVNEYSIDSNNMILEHDDFLFVRRNSTSSMTALYCNVVKPV